MLAVISALLLGFLSGAGLFVALVAVPFWRELPASEFRLWFAANWHRVAWLMVPLGGGETLASVAAWIVGHRSPRARRFWLAAAAAASLGATAVTLLVNEPANQLFGSTRVLADSETTALLARWSAWHWAREALAAGGFYAALRALSAPGNAPDDMSPR